MSNENQPRPGGLRATLRWLKQLMVQGRDPAMAAPAAATGLTVGVMPLYGPTTLISIS